MEDQEEPRLIDSADLRCSFCGKAHSEVETIVATPVVAICNECVEMCTEIIAGERGPSEAA